MKTFINTKDFSVTRLSTKMSICFWFVILINSNINGQSFNYVTNTGTLGTTYSWIDCSGGSSIVSGDDSRANVSWPFSFSFYGTTYTTSNTISVSTNGFIRLNGSATNNASTAQNYTLNSSGTGLGRIIALGVYDDNVGDTGSWIRYVTTGTAPNRVFTIEYNNLEIDYNDNKYADIQVSFYETLNKVVIKLGDDDVSASGADMGIHSGTSGYFNKWQEVANGTNNAWIEYTMPVEVDASGGTTQSYYSTLKESFDAINAGTHTGTLTIKLNGSTTETSTATLNASGSGSASYSSLVLYPTISGLSVAGTLTTPLVQLNGADNVTIDGRVNQTGVGDLTISNSSTAAGARTIELTSSAEANYIEYCNIKGAGATSTQGTINLSTSDSGNGNDGNYIQYNNITSIASGSRPVNLIYSAGASGYTNDQNYIRNNNLYDFFQTGATSNAVNISSYSSGFTITGNSFYQTASFAPTASFDHVVIRIDNTSGNDFTITDNYIGGNAASCSGTWTKTNAYNNAFTGIYLNIGSNNNSIQGNTIKGFSYANSGAANWTGIQIDGGSANIGTASGNTIGQTTGTGSVSFTAGATGALLYGINIATTGTVTVSNNLIGSITTNASSSTYAANLYGIYKAAVSGSVTISNNLIGSTTTTNSINTSSAATAGSQLLYGIYNLGTGSITISDNTVANISNSTTETTLASRTRGIFSNDGANTVNNNKIYKIITGGLSNGANYANASIVGISVISNTVGNAQTLSNNTVNNMETTATGKIEMYGIFFDGPDATNAVISRNFVHSFIIPTGGSTSSYLHGISLYDGSYTASNNIVYLGSNISIGCSIWGIWTGTDNNAKVYHNTIYLAGTATSGSSNSFAFRSLFCPSSLDLRNNILWDDRVNSSGTISHYALYLNCTSNTTVNYNDYQFEQQFGIAAGTTYNTFSAWKSGTGLDANSLDIDPLLVNLNGTLPIDYQTTVQLQGTTIAGISTDFDGVTRVTPTMGAWEFFANPVEIWNGNTFREDYTTLKLAFDDINNGTYTGDLTIKFRGNTNETVPAVLNANGAGAASYSHILVYPARSGIVVSGTLSQPMIDLNGADNVTFDGRVNGTGTMYEFTFINNSTSTNTSTSVFRLNNSALSDTIRYCVIKGAATGSATANIIFGSSVSGSGNNNNVILSNKLTSVSDNNRPVNVIYSAGTSGLANTSNKIQSNLIYDFLNKSNDSYGINIQSYSNSTRISDNSFYETTSLAPTATVTYRIINIDDTNSNQNIISSNYIGGNATLAAGTWTKTNASSNLFYGISINVGTTTASTIDGNIIRNFSYSNSQNNDWYGIHLAGGKVNVGSSTGNTIGATSGTGSITVSNTTSGGSVYGVNIASTSGVKCENNVIASITAANSNSSYATSFVGINKTAVAGNTDINANTIGSNTTANSIQTSSSANSSAQTLYGISSAGTGTITIAENTIANLTNSTSNTTTTTKGRINGILVSDGSENTVSKNTIRDLTIANANTATDFEMSVVGINLINTIANRTISKNTIYSLSNTYTSYTGSLSGIYYRGAITGTNTVSQNFIHSLSITNAGGNLVGILVSSGNTTYSNNIIVLGNATNNVVYGLYDVNNTDQTCNAYFNTIYIGGATSGANFSYALYSGLASGTRNYRNNILYNVRTNSTSGVYNAAIAYVTAGTAGLTTDYNIYYTNGTGTVVGLWAGATKTLTTLRTATLGDTNSNTTNPTFVSAGSTTATDYKVGVTLTGASGISISIDYGSYSRPVTAPTIGAWERNVNKWKGITSTDWGTASNWTGNLVPDVDATIEFDVAPVNHCVMDQNRSVTNIINAQGTYRVVTNGKTLTIKGELQFTNGAQIDASSAASKVILAGTVAQSIPAGSFYNNEVFNLDVNNSNNVTLNGTIRLLGTISSVLGRFDTYTNSTTFVYGGINSQTIETDVFMNNKAYNVTIDNGSGVTLNTDFSLNNNLNINSGKLLTLSAARTLTVQGTVTNSAGTDGLIIKASSTAANGSLIYYNSQANAVQATVEMYSRSTWDLTKPSGSKYNWQFFGIPLRTLSALPTFYGGYVRKQLESGTTTTNHWVYLSNDSVLSPFYGYELCFQTTRTLLFAGELVNSNFNSGQLARTSGAIYPGQHLFANPYAAAIDIRQIEFGSDMEATVYLYNTGTYNQWDTNLNKVGATPGQYISIPKNLAGYAGIPRQVPSMSSMLTVARNSTTNAYINIPYSSVAMGNSEMQRAPGKVKANVLQEDDVVSTYIGVESANSADNMWIFTSNVFTRNYDNGYDGVKKYPAAGIARLFASETDNDYQIDAVDDLNNTVMKFRAATQDTQYTMTFTHKHTDTKYESIYLLDMNLDSLTDITETGSTYEFTATNSTASELRFRIIANPISSGDKGTTTSAVNVYAANDNLFLKKLTNANAVVRITDISGKIITECKLNGKGLASLPIKKQTVYIVTIITPNETYTQKVLLYK